MGDDALCLVARQPARPVEAGAYPWLIPRRTWGVPDRRAGHPRDQPGAVLAHPAQARWSPPPARRSPVGRRAAAREAARGQPPPCHHVTAWRGPGAGCGTLRRHAGAPCSRGTGYPTRQVPSRNRFGNGRSPGSFLQGAAPARWRAALRRVGDDPAQCLRERRRIREEAVHRPPERRAVLLTRSVLSRLFTAGCGRLPSTRRQILIPARLPGRTAPELVFDVVNVADVVDPDVDQAVAGEEA